MIDLDGLVTEKDDGLWGEATAVFSPDRIYRYRLTRRWADGPGVAFVMLNPSTADAFTVDPTVRRCLGFARAWGAGALTVVNVFALRSTDPDVLRSHPDPVGPVNDAVLTGLDPADYVRVVAAWGPPAKLGGRGARVAEMLTGRGVDLHALRVTKDGYPGHPLFLRGDAVPVPFGVPSAS